jgi:ATP-binding cassette subfamily F protein 3
VETALAAPGNDYAELGRRLAHVGAEVAMLEDRWLELQTEVQALLAEES